MTVRRRTSALPLDPDPSATSPTTRPIDPLTGLLTRQALFAVLTGEFVSTGETVLTGESLSTGDLADSDFVGILVVKVARLRRINALYGQRYGDRCLIEMAEWLRDATEVGDVVARTSGNRFAILYTAGSSILTEVRDGARRILQVGTMQIEVVVQGGWAQRSANQTLAELFEQADLAGEVAGNTSSPVFVASSAELSARAADKLASEEIVRSAIRDDGLTVAFQPVVDVSSRAVHSVEALARLKVDAGLPADRIVSLGRELGLGAVFAGHILDIAFRHVGFLAPVMPDIKVAVNMSRELLGGGHAIDEIARAATASNVSLDRVIVEMTEEVAEGVSGQALRDALSLGLQAGMDMVVDDFGRGETSLALLRSLPLTAIKLDRSLVAADADDDGWRFLEALVRTLQVITPRLIAEGVETATQSRRLVQLGVAVQQGYLFGRPQSYEHWLRSGVTWGE